MFTFVSILCLPSSALCLPSSVYCVCLRQHYVYLRQYIVFTFVSTMFTSVSILCLPSSALCLPSSVYCVYLRQHYVYLRQYNVFSTVYLRPGNTQAMYSSQQQLTKKFDILIGCHRKIVLKNPVIDEEVHPGSQKIVDSRDE
jgi:hypothetical protein